MACFFFFGLHCLIGQVFLLDFLDRDGFFPVYEAAVFFRDQEADTSDVFIGGLGFRGLRGQAFPLESQSRGLTICFSEISAGVPLTVTLA